ncbi:delta-aminolevulinic acid dehydratase [Anaerocolumna cellulosilytica]|uniref:Delta-aminolevulinic acid dehydratase n=1 Tax=Anaerocolumna cellulosilytica TaxID=433286 RepID=A0A6S6QXI8_9FIRM|nr:porphobilinogen synthase [Anaerocolumna cellulosilytica]MBB5197151.1 porphobilinogen synthase [Anaerocolumna cellulosilytica]BCJ95364.1 delta-aminolevulinic acid dehydratase [Anaerocolumna cellulosilytica]
MIRRRRLRVNETIRSLVRETSLAISDFIYPIFIIEGENIKNPIDSMPGINQYSVDRLGEELQRVKRSGVKNILLFGIPIHKDEVGSEAYNPDGVTQKAIRYIKSSYPEFTVTADICLCEYTSHGHCGMIEDGEVLNDETLPLLAKAAVSCAKAGADIIAPSDMMDGHIKAIREALDENHYINTPIMAYSAKYASAYYAPFRDAAHSAPSFGDRKTYQMDYGNVKEAVREVLDDIEEGADIVMVKPALAYLDVIKTVSLKTDYPIAAYNVSGEYSMVKAAAANGWIDEKKVVMENLTAMKRAGAGIIITYHALDAAKWIKGDSYEG